METLHRCPECGASLDEVGRLEVLAEETKNRRQRRLSNVAQGRLQQVKRKHWFHRHRMEVALFLAMVTMVPMVFVTFSAAKSNDPHTSMLFALFFFVSMVILGGIIMDRIEKQMWNGICSAFIATYPKWSSVPLPKRGW